MQPGDKIGRYMLEKQIGEGAMSVVFVAKHPQLEPRVALKILRREVSADKQYADRFLEDARAAAILNHPNIVGVKDFDTADGVPFIVMELVDGWSLDQWLKEKGRLEVRDAARVARDVALGLDAAHASKIVHRDVKPSNVLIDSRTGAAKLTDFGAAKRDRPQDQTLTAHGQTIGTPRYMAPEQVHGEPVDPRTDLWALGATLYEMLAGQPAFTATSLPRLYQAIVAEDPPRLARLCPEVPAELATLVARLLSKSRDGRPDTADEVAEALLRFGLPNTTTTATAARRPTRSELKSTSPASGVGVGRKPLIGRTAVASLSAVALTGILSVGGWWIWSTWTAPHANASIAVLPFDNLSGDEATGRLADGITEDIITELTRFRALDVMAGSLRSAIERETSMFAMWGGHCVFSTCWTARSSGRATGCGCPPNSWTPLRLGTSGPIAGTVPATMCLRCRARSPKPSRVELPVPIRAKSLPPTAMQHDASQ